MTNEALKEFELAYHAVSAINEQDNMTLKDKAEILKCIDVRIRSHH